MRLRLWMLVLLLLALPLWLLLRIEVKKAAVSVARADSMRQKASGLEQQQRNYEVLMRQPQNAAVLTQADFLNSLFKHKAFSWTATLTDLETVLPAGVQVLSVDPVVAPSGHVSIHLRVSGQRDRALQLVRNLERSKHFAQPRLASEALANTGNGQSAMTQAAANDVNFDIVADYRPLPIKPQAVATEQPRPQRRAKKKEYVEPVPPAEQMLNPQERP